MGSSVCKYVFLQSQSANVEELQRESPQKCYTIHLTSEQLLIGEDSSPWGKVLVITQGEDRNNYLLMFFPWSTEGGRAAHAYTAVLQFLSFCVCVCACFFFQFFPFSVFLFIPTWNQSMCMNVQEIGLKIKIWKGLRNGISYQAVINSSIVRLFLVGYDRIRRVKGRFYVYRVCASQYKDRYLEDSFCSFLNVGTKKRTSQWYNDEHSRATK